MQKISFLILFFSVIFGLFLPLQKIGSEVQVEAQAEVQNTKRADAVLVIIAEVEGEIKAGTFQYLKRIFDLAKEYKADYLVIKLDTPGGLLKATKDIVDLILDSPIKTIVFVNKGGGWAYSAGTFILLSADYAVVHPKASIGAAQPVVMGAGEAAATKMIEGMASWMRTLAEIHQRNPETAENFVRENLTLTGQEAKELGVIDETAENLDELFLKLNISEPRIKEIYPTLVEKIFDFLSHPHLISLFLTIGGLAIIMAIRSGEFELTGIIGAIAFLIGLWGIGVITFSFLGIGLLLLGIFLLMMELFIEPGFGIFGISGTIAIILGIFTFEAEPLLAPELFDAMTMFILGMALALCIFFVFIGKVLRKSLRAKAQTGSEALIGLSAEVVKELNPRGQVKIKGEIWTAESIDGEAILKGVNVEILKVEGNTLFVSPVRN